MTISTTSNTTTQQGNGSNMVWNYSFLIPDADSAVVTVTTISTGATAIINPSLYTITGLDNESGGTVTYPLSGSPLSTLFNISIQRILPLTQETDLVNQGAFYPDVVENEFDNLCMLIQQLQQEIDQALAFPVGASDTSVPALMAAILNGAANAAAAAASAAAAAASAATVLALLPLQTANIGDAQVTTAKLASNSITAIKLATAVIPQGVGMINGTITESRAANAVTYAVKTLAGADPSATDPVYFVFRDVTVGLGDFVVIARITAMSLTISAGSTLGFTSAVAGKLWLTVFNDSSTLRLGVINCLSGTTIYPLGAFPIASSTAEGGAGGADSAQVFYTGAAVSSKAYIPIAYASYESGLTTAGNWDAAPTRIQLFGHGVPLPGTPVQVVQTVFGTVVSGSTAMPQDNTIPQITEGNEYATRAITPTSAAHLLETWFNGSFNTNTGGSAGVAVFNTDIHATNAQAAMATWITASAGVSVSLDYSVIAGRTTATTFRWRFGLASGTVVFNGLNGGTQTFGGVMGSLARVREIAT